MEPTKPQLTELEKDAVHLLFALRDAWPYVHQRCTIESIENRIVALMRKHGDFADLHEEMMAALHKMTAHRAIYFMERFKHEEKMLGPNEQAALDFVIEVLEAHDELLSKCAQCKKEYKHSKAGVGCPKCAPGVDVPESEFQKPITTKPWVGLTPEEIAQGNKESWVTEQAWQSAVWWAEDKLKEKNA